jgi:hypothetical protein
MDDAEMLREALEFVLSRWVVLSQDGQLVEREGHITPGFGGWYVAEDIPAYVRPTLEAMRDKIMAKAAAGERPFLSC